MADIPHCPGPDPQPHGPARFLVPPGAVDTHAHVIGLPPDHPFEATRSYTPPAAPADAYLRMLDATGMAKGVLVQVSVHGTDNGLMLQTLRAHPDRLRGIAVTPLGLADSAYAALKEAGVTGLRLNVLYGGGMSMDQVEGYGDLCRELGWHLQFLLDARTLPQLKPRLTRLPVPIVIDHMGHFPMQDATVQEPGFQTLLDLVRDGAWVKLSGAYRMSSPPYRATIPFAQALVAAAPEHCLWGSDWPNVATYEAMPNIGDLLDLFGEWVPDEAQRRAVFVDNPRRLYGF